MTPARRDVYLTKYGLNTFPLGLVRYLLGLWTRFWFNVDYGLRFIVIFHLQSHFTLFTM